MNECQHCHAPAKDDHTLCMRCHIRFARILLRLGKDVTPLQDSLDATLHPGGHQPIRIQPSEPPTPIRLDVLDELDIIDATTNMLWHILDGTEQDHEPSLRATLALCARHPRLCRFSDAGLYLGTFQRIARRVDEILDPASERQLIGRCTNPLCRTPLTAGSRDQWATCPICGREQRVLTVKLAWLHTLCDDPAHTGSAAEIAKVFATCGIPLKRNTINQWARRGRLDPMAPGRYRYGDIWRLVQLDNPKTVTDNGSGLVGAQGEANRS